MEACTDEQLAVRIATGDCDEGNRLWEELCARHEPLLRVIARRARAEYLALCSGLYLHLKGADGRWRRLRSFHGTSAPFRNWFAVVASRVASSLRDESAGRTTDLEELPAGQEGASSMRKIEILLALARLRHGECRVLLRRRYWNQETFEELAGPFGRTSATLRQMHRRNLKELGELLKDEG